MSETTSPLANTVERPILLIDALNLFLRNFVVNPSMDANGAHVGGVIGSLRSIKCLVRDINPQSVIVIWDGKGGSVKRRGVRADYKAGRKPRVNREYDFGESPAAGELSMRTQVLSLRRYIELLGLRQIEVDDIEADDVIGYLCRQMFPDSEKVIVSTDRDFLQLADSKTIIYSPIKKIYYSSDRVLKEYDCLSENFIYLKALCGDGSDNIKGIKGFGIKTVHKLFPFMAERATTLEEIISYSAEHVSENKRYGSITGSVDILTDNVSLMQLSLPVIGSASIREIRYALDKRPTYVPSELKLCLIRDGIQLTDSDFFTIFKAHSVIS